ncbi:MAG: CHAP domain-containing protein [Bacteroidaceae bacterium]|nr:CHAP domain-containing protein [Bacteroidaceae bacterium]MBQ8542299.1 CHAP domain-containing protein [Bacteroidaceae bacterium]
MAILLLVITVPVLAPIVGRFLDYDADVAVRYVTENAEPRSRNCCAWYVMRAMQTGGCPIYILPAFGYSWLLPQFGFVEIGNSSYIPELGDIVVFPAVKGHIWGHIQMWNGRQWVSDFKQKGFYAAQGYMNSGYKIFRYKSSGEK